MKFTAPHIEYDLLSPILIIVAVAVLGVLVEAAVPRARRYVVQVGLAVVGVVAALVAAFIVLGRINPTSDKPKLGYLVAEDALALDGPTLYSWIVILVLALLGVLLFAERRLEGGITAFAGQAAALPGTEGERQASAKGLEHTEVFPLLMFAVAGMLAFPAANDLLTLFVALEVLSLPLYLLCGLARRRRLLSQEAALKYFMLGAFSSGFFVYGIALVYGYSGSMSFDKIAFAVSSGSGSEALLLGGMGMLAVGLLFKVGAAPFHAWTPDVYQGAPTPVTAFMAAATKVAAFGALLRLFYVAFGGARWDWQPTFWAIAILTMVVGSVLALSQTDVKRLLAYSSIAHAGFLLVGFLGARSLSEINVGDINPVQAVLFYVTTYGLTTMAAFAIVSVVRDGSGEATQMSRWAGLGKESPLLAGSFAFLLLGMAGIPLTSGFTGKWAVFAAALSAGAWPVVIVAVLMSAVAAYFYVRLIVVMFFTDPVGDGPTVTVPSLLTSSVIAVGTLGTLVLGVVPGPLLDLLGRTAQFIR
ncbi:NADH-quinone oxidoreductase subunit NuoN [Nocardioides marmoriginsengisoli]|uniref:NADH-quinone oxidoreductase subunit N n=1 Tax=Nocardioides marmoriginsengisoli TaxID=661483 RepID=A0A3N0CFR5_9ACTN|nr:NADH-quinone oxidoreductase subunit NuoN [Nocardioides marmoriginsengisoli]RNL62310.1 NADH-quinone oxidoreductase subunit NuoN [Nocardioides marmoriginsengisoli]